MESLLFYRLMRSQGELKWLFKIIFVKGLAYSFLCSSCNALLLTVLCPYLYRYKYKYRQWKIQYIYIYVLCVCAQSLNRVRLFATPWTAAHQAPLSMGFPRQEYWSGLPFPTLGDLPDPEIKPASLASPTLAGVFSTTGPPGKPL